MRVNQGKLIQRMKQHVTKPEDKLSVATKVGYGTGQAAQRLQLGSLNQMAVPIFNDILGVDPRLIGLSLGISRVVDALTDPLMGHISDRTTSKYGRRRPWIALSALLCSLAFSAIWLFPRGMSQGFYLVWFLVTTLFFFMALSMFAVPYSALGMELTPDPHERTSVVAYRTAMATIGGLLVSSLYWIINLGCFRDMAHGMRCTGVGFGVLVGIFTLIPVFFAKEHPKITRGRNRRSVQKTGLFASAKQTLTHAPFLLLLGATVVLSCGLGLVLSMSYYVTVYHVFNGIKDADTGFILSIHGYACILGSLLGLPAMTFISRRLGKRRTLLAGMLFAMIGSLLKWICYTPDHPYLILIPGFVMAFSMVSVWVSLQAMLPEIVDLDELKTDERREGMFSAIQSWTLKMGHSLTVIASGFVLNASGFDATLAIQSESAVYLLRVFYTVIPAAALLVSFLIMLFYPLTDKRAYEIRRELDERDVVSSAKPVAPQC